MTDANKAILTAAADKLTTALAALTAGQNEVTRLSALATEYQRQIDYHTQRGDTVDAENVAPLLNNTYSLLSGAQAKAKTLQAAYDSAFAGYQAAESLLSQEEKDEIKILAQSNASVATANAAAKGVEAEAKASALKSEFFAKNVKYFIVGVIVVVIAIGVIIYMRKKGKKVA